MFFIYIFQIKKLLNKPVVRESCYYRKLTDRGKDEPIPSLNESQIENLTGELTWIFVAMTVSISVMRKILTRQSVDIGGFIEKIQLTCDWELLSIKSFIPFFMQFFFSVR